MIFLCSFPPSVCSLLAILWPRGVPGGMAILLFTRYVSWQDGNAAQSWHSATHDLHANDGDRGGDWNRVPMPVSARLHAELSRARVIARLNRLIGQLSLSQYAATGGDVICWPNYVQLCYNRLHCASSQLVSIGPFLWFNTFLRPVMWSFSQTKQFTKKLPQTGSMLIVRLLLLIQKWMGPLAKSFPSPCFVLLWRILASEPKPGAGTCCAWGEHLALSGSN